MPVDLTMTVLVVDDYRTMVRILRNLLTQIGFSNIDEAADGEEAWGKIRKSGYGLIISDWNMEPMSGFELLRQVRADEDHQDTPFIMVTAESKSENVAAAQKAGVSTYIVKPFNAETLRARLRTVLGDF